MSELGPTWRSAHGAFIVDRRETILGFDRTMEALTGWPAVEVVGRHKNLGCAVSHDGAQGEVASVPLYDGLLPAAAAGRNTELTVHCRDGRRLEVETVVERLPGPGERTLVRILRVLSRSAVNGVRNGNSRRDALTGLSTAEAFTARLANEFRSATLSAEPLAVILADVDHLREINDRLGHAAGDDVLRKLAGILRVSVEDESCIARLGDDDFAVLLPGSGRGEARQLAASLRSTVERYRFFAPDATPTPAAATLSLGAASFPADAESAGDLMDRARDALNEARAMGRNRVWCYLRRPRVPLEVPVFFEGAEALLVGYTRDLSPSGIFVQTSAPIEIGMRCALAFPIPGHEGKVHVIGRVVRTVPTHIADDEQSVRIPGMGVEFERFSGTADRKAIEGFLHRHEGRTQRPERGLLSL